MDWQAIHEFDQQISLIINSWHSPLSDSIMIFFSLVKIWFPMYLAFLVFLYFRMDWKRATIVSISLILMVVFCDPFANLIKESVGRLRPSHDPFMLENGLNLLEGKANKFGFFSAHAANSFGFAICSTLGIKNDKRLRYRGWSYPIFFWAFMVSISRIFVGKHYLGDVIVGALVGLIIGTLLALMARVLIKITHR